MTTDERDQLELLRTASRNSLNANQDLALSVNRKYLHFARSVSARHDVAMAYKHLGIVYYNLRDFDKAKTVLLKAKSIFSSLRDKREVNTVYASLGAVYRQTKELSRAIECYQKVIQSGVESLGVATTYNNISIIYSSQGDVDSAEYYLQKGIQLVGRLSSINKTIPLFRLHLSLVNIYIKSQRINQAKEYLDICRKYLQHEEVSDNLTFRYYYHLADVFSISGNIESAEKNYEFAREIVSKLNLDVHHINISFRLAKVLSQNSNYSRRRDVLERAYSIAQERQPVYIRSCLIHLIEHYKEVQNYHVALDYLERLNTIAAEERQIEKETQLSELQEKLRSTEQRLEIERLKKEEALKVELEHQNHHLAQMNEELGQFNYVVSHDLKEPARQMKNFSGILLQRIGHQLDARSREMLEIISQSSERMHSMVEDLLHFASVGTEDLEAEDVDLNRILDMVRSNLRLMLEENGADLVIDDLPVVRGYTGLWLQLLQNLVSNAVKFRHPDRSPEVIVSTDRTPDQLLIRVADNGVGMDEQDLAHIFKMFKRVGDPARTPGSGIGLSICRKIATRMNLGLDVRSEKESGTTFQIAVPLEVEVR